MFQMAIACENKTKNGKKAIHGFGLNLYCPYSVLALPFANLKSFVRMHRFESKKNENRSTPSYSHNMHPNNFSAHTFAFSQYLTVFVLFLFSVYQITAHIHNPLIVANAANCLVQCMDFVYMQHATCCCACMCGEFNVSGNSASMN